MKGQTRFLVIALALFLLLVAVSVFVQLTPPSGSGVVATPFYSRVYPDLDPATVTAIRVVDAEGAGITLQRDFTNNSWVLEANGAVFPSEVASNMAQTMSILPYTQRLNPPTEDELRGYGLTRDQALLIAVVTNDGQTRALLVGSLTPSGTSYFVLVDNRPEVYVIERAAIDYFAAVTRNVYAEFTESP